MYAERGDEILLLQRAEGSAMAGQWFLPGGFVEAGELPEEGARRELFEEGGVSIDGELELVGCYPMHVYGYDMLQISYRGRVVEGEVTISHEHDGARWVKASDMRALLTDDVITDMAGGNDDVALASNEWSAVHLKGTRQLRPESRPIGPSTRRIAAQAECPEITSVALRCRTRHQ